MPDHIGESFAVLQTDVLFIERPSQRGLRLI